MFDVVALRRLLGRYLYVAMIHSRYGLTRLCAASKVDEAQAECQNQTRRLHADLPDT